MAWTLKGTDTFTDTALTGIASHTPSPSGGFTWSAISAFGGVPRISVDGTEFNVGGGGDGMALCGLTLAAKQAAEATLFLGTTRVGVLWDSSGNGYCYIVRDGLSSFICRFDAGSQTNIATGGPNTSPGDVARLESDGAGGLTAYVNGVSVLTATDTTYPTGKAAIGCGPGDRADTFHAYEDAGAGGGAAAPQLTLLGCGA